MSTEKQTTVHITPHVHWDREWYFTAEQSKILLLNDLDEVLTRLEKDPSYPFYLLDGQTAILEDYLSIKPENKPRITKLVQQGRLIIGPWYSQTDTMIVGAESIVHNLLYGLKDCTSFGDSMKIGYLPDSFSMSAQLPHIYNGFDIYRTLFWRGCSERHGTDKTEFIWQSDDQSSVIAQVLPLGYAIGKYLPDNDNLLHERLDSYFEVLENASITKEILLPNGHDQMPIQQNIFEIIKRLQAIYPNKHFKLSRFETVFEKIEAIQNQLALIKGEFNDGKYMRVHRTISSTRMDIKVIHALTEYKMSHLLEPLASLAWLLGFEYQGNLIEKIWKELLKSHAHDSIGCCCSDIVHKQIFNRFELANDMAQNLINFYLRKIVDHQHDDSDNRLVFFNLSPHIRHEVIHAQIRIKSKQFKLVDSNNQEVPYFITKAIEIDPGLIDRQIVHYGNYEPFMEYDIQLQQSIPAMGYTSYQIKQEAPTCLTMTQTKCQIDQEQILENEFYHISINQDGTLNITDKQTKQYYHHVLRFEDGSDDGDEYDYSPLAKDWLCYQDQYDVQLITVEHQAYQSKATIMIKMPLPSDLQERQLQVCSSFVAATITIILAANSPRIDIEMQINNQARDHRLRVLIPTSYETDHVIADNQFGTITRPIHDPALISWQQEHWKEAPISVWQFLNFSVLQNKDQEQATQGLALLSQGLREFEIIKDPSNKQANTFALTLFRSVGLLGKENLLLRPGRPSGIKMETPDSQMIGQHPLSYKFSLISFSGNWMQAQIAQQARDYSTPILSYNKTLFDGLKLNKTAIQTPLSYSLFSIPSPNITPNIVLSTLKKAETEEALIIRLYNPSQQEIIAQSINWGEKTGTCQETNLNEQPITSQDKQQPLELFKACQSRSFKIKRQY